MSSVFSAFLLTLSFVSLAAFGVSEDAHLRYIREISDLGVNVSPLTLVAHNWAAVMLHDHNAAEILGWVATGVSLNLQDVTPFEVPNYIKEEHLDFARADMKEEVQIERRFVR